jgi:elongation of very long chain fatty acids protein 6
MDSVLSRYPLEERFNSSKVVSYAAERWHYSFHISALYVLGVFALRRYMSTRQRFNLRLPLFMWSLTLALFSILGSVVTAPVMLQTLLHHGWEGSICHDIFTAGQPGLWTFLFCFSKFPELVDTLFIVLRKQKLIFLHWYHHVTVFIYCWYHYAVQLRPAQWFVTLNFLVHSIMYSYFALRASGRVRPPIWVNMFITFLQLLQMVVGVSINVFIYQQMTADQTWHCDGQVETSYFFVYWSFAMYFSYFVLFAHFFWCAYFCKSPPSSVSMENVQANGDVIKKNFTFTNGHIPNDSLSHCNGVTRRCYLANANNLTH